MMGARAARRSSSTTARHRHRRCNAPEKCTPHKQRAQSSAVRAPAASHGRRRSPPRGRLFGARSRPRGRSTASRALGTCAAASAQGDGTPRAKRGASEDDTSDGRATPSQDSDAGASAWYFSCYPHGHNRLASDRSSGGATENSQFERRSAQRAWTCRSASLEAAAAASWSTRIRSSSNALSFTSAASSS